MSDFKNRYKDIVLLLLNQIYKAGLDKDVETIYSDNTKLKFDLADRSKHIYVELVEKWQTLYRGTDSKNLVSKFIALQKRIPQAKTILVFTENITLDDRDYLIERFNSFKTEIQILDYNEILESAYRSKLITSKEYESNKNIISIENDTIKEATDQKKRYWAGGFGKGEEFYARLEEFKKERYWNALDYDEDSNPIAAENAWNIFRKIEIGDWFIIKGYGGNHNLTVHYIGEIYAINKKEGKLYFNTINRLLYKGEAPRGEGAGNWRNTLLEVTRPEDINMLFYTEELKNIEINEIQEYDNFIKGTLSHHYTNPNNHKVFDQLNVTNDIKAFASLLAYKNATPPIAIGLFGNWGSGKSYFMANIRKEIEVLSATKNLDYCDRIVHVEFNSWFYRDADLWSSLVAKIFYELNVFLNEDENEPSVDSFYKELTSVKEDLEVVSIELKEIQLEQTELALKLSAATAEKDRKAEKLSGVKIKDILSAVLENKLVKEELDKVNIDLEKKVGDSIDELQKSANELDSEYKRFIVTLKLFWGKGTRFVWFIAFIVLVVGAIPFIYSSIQDQLTVIVTGFIHAVAFITGFKSFLQPIYKKVNKGYLKLDSIVKSWNKLVENEKNKKSLEIKELETEVEIAKQKEEILIANIAVKSAKENALRKEITDIKSGKKLVEFVQERSKSDRYKSKLGVISWVREDFEELDKLIRRHKQANEIENNISSIISEDIKIDRIILYVDDLDRCPEDRVVEVLEAVHLLLSFELFEVVVGVDPRWVSHALNKKYSALVNPNDSNANLKKSINASTYDYLEKIFQIPFTLLPIEEQGAKNLITSYINIEDAIEITHIKPSDDLGQSNNKQDNLLEISKDLHDSLNSKNNQIEGAVDSKKLHITKEELNYILIFASLIGSTPRTIQRFVNTYRIIRAHPKVELTQQLSLQHKCIISYLALVVGKPFIAEIIIKKLNQLNNDNISFSDFIKEFDNLPELQHILASETYKDLADTKVITFKTWAPLISRFSFHVVDDVT